MELVHIAKNRAYICLKLLDVLQFVFEVLDKFRFVRMCFGMVGVFHM